MIARVLTILVLLALAQFLLGHVLVHLGLIAVAGLSWWAWSRIEGRRHV